MVILFVVGVFVTLEGDCLLWCFSFAPLSRNTDKNGFYTMDICTNLAAELPWRWWWPPRGGSFVLTHFRGNLPHFVPVLGNTDKYGSYTLVWCTTWLWSSYEGNWWWPLEVARLLWRFSRNLPPFVPLFGNTDDRAGSYILGICTSLAAEQP